MLKTKTLTGGVNVTGCVVMNNIALSESEKKKLHPSIKVNRGTFSPLVSLAPQTQLPW